MTPTIACALTVAVGTPIIMFVVGWLLRKLRQELFRFVDWMSQATAQINANARTTMADFGRCNHRFRSFDQHLADLEQAHSESKAAFERTLVDHSRLLNKLGRDSARLDALDQYVQELPTFEDTHGITDSEREAMRANLVAAIRRAADDIEQGGEFEATEVDLDPETQAAIDEEFATSDPEPISGTAHLEARLRVALAELNRPRTTAEITAKLAAEIKAESLATKTADDPDLDTIDDEFTGDDAPVDPEGSTAEMPAIAEPDFTVLEFFIQGFLDRNGRWINPEPATPAADPRIIPFDPKYRRPTE